ncbi:MAG: hypothetical protein ABSG15_00180 [FCB group bacterium]|jgi:hypothetical protein
MNNNAGIDYGQSNVSFDESEKELLINDLTNEIARLNAIKSKSPSEALNLSVFKGWLITFKKYTPKDLLSFIQSDISIIDDIIKKDIIKKDSNEKELLHSKLFGLLRKSR